MAEPIRVYWMPGCSSCVKVKEFLTSLNVPYEGVNILAEPNAMADLAKIGAKSIPVVVRGDQFTFAQSLTDVAKFVGKDPTFQRLEPAQLVARWRYFLETSQEIIAGMDREQLEVQPVKGRDRTLRNLAYHIFQIPDAFLRNQQEGLVDILTIFAVDEPAHVRSAEDILAYARPVTARLASWWDGLADKSCVWPSLTYDGEHPTHEFLERSVWHSAQHARQLMAALDDIEAELPVRIDSTFYQGLPMPAVVWQ